MILSIVMPVYNVIDFIDRSIKSIIKQSFQSWELILIDDGSTDGSGERAEYWATKDKRIRVFHQKNMGASAARNHGLTQCNGLYIYFVDADDYLEQGLLQEINDEINAHDSDIILVNAKRFFAENKIRGPELYVNNRFSTEMLRRLLLCGFLREPFLKVCKKELIAGKKFQENLKSANDLAFVPDLVEKAKKISCTEKHFYLYNKMNSNSITKKKTELQKNVCDFYAWKRFSDFCDRNHWEKINENFTDYYTAQRLYHAIYLLENLATIDQNSDPYKEILSYVKSHGINLKENKKYYFYFKNYFCFESYRLGWEICDTPIGEWGSRAVRALCRFYSVASALNIKIDESKIRRFVNCVDRNEGISTLSIGQKILYKGLVHHYLFLSKIKGFLLLRNLE